MIQPGVGYTVRTDADGSQTLSIDGADSFGGIAASSPPVEQFQIFISGNILTVANGTAIWAPHKFNDPEATPSLCANQTIVKTYTRYTGDSVTVGTNASSGFMSQGGSVSLSI